MTTEISIADFFERKPDLPIIDVRSPGEFEKGHIPSAINIPLFSDKERSDVGTVYVQKTQEKAIELGYKYVTPKLEWFISESRKVADQSRVAVHCWRGGMRSHAFAQHLHKNGFQQVYVITGGYKAFRNHTLRFFEQPFRLNILGGYTGSGKTHILKVLKENGEQVIDLEGIAHHKGSAFGAIGELPQPTVEQFENNLFDKMRKLNHKASIWIEDESHDIGRVKIPMGLYRQIREQIVYFIDIPKVQRAKHLVEEYAAFENSKLAYSINGIAKRLGGQNVKMAHEYLKQKNYFEVAMLALQYYDKAYKRGVQDRNQKNIWMIPLTDVNHNNNAKSIIKFIKKHDRNKTYTI